LSRLSSRSSSLFAIYITNIENIVRKRQAGDLVDGRKKVWSLTYADDIILVVKETADLKEILKRELLERFRKKEN